MHGNNAIKSVSFYPVRDSASDIPTKWWYLSLYNRSICPAGIIYSEKVAGLWPPGALTGQIYCSTWTVCQGRIPSGHWMCCLSFRRGTGAVSDISPSSWSTHFWEILYQLDSCQTSLLSSVYSKTRRMSTSHQRASERKESTIFRAGLSLLTHYRGEPLWLSLQSPNQF